jgi:hypothetical protein
MHTHGDRLSHDFVCVDWTEYGLHLLLMQRMVQLRLAPASDDESGEESGSEEEEEEAGELVEFNVVDPSDPDDEGAEDEPLELDRIDFSKLETIFSKMTFQANYLAKFVSGITAKKILLRLTPDTQRDDGNFDRHPLIMEHNVGKKCRFTFILAPVPEEDD